MIITERDKRLAYRKKKREYKGRPRPKGEVRQACEEAGANYWTVIKRMRPRAEGGQGMTLKEAIETPVTDSQEHLKKAAKKSHWQHGIPGMGPERT